MEKLESCPFCSGNKIKLVNSIIAMATYYECDDCLCQGPWGPLNKPEEAKKLWNQRKTK